MTYYSVLSVTPRQNDWVEDYLPAANRLVEAHGGKYLARTSTHEQIEGEVLGEDVALRIIIEWPNEEAAKAFECDAEYAPHLEARLNGSTSRHYLIAGQDDLA